MKVSELIKQLTQFYMNYDHTELYSALSEACIDESDMEEVA